MSKYHELFDRNMQLLSEHLRINKIPILRLIYIDKNSEMMSITLPTSKVLSSGISRLESILKNDKLLIPDASTGFSDPSSVHENYCVIANFPEDERSMIQNKAITCFAKINIILNNYQNNNLDIFHDFRNELMLEGIKAGIDIVTHESEDNRKQSIVIEADSLLNVADSIHKMRFLTNCVAGSYGKNIDLSSKENTIDLYKTSGQIILTDFIESNPYLLVKYL